MQGSCPYPNAPASSYALMKTSCECTVRKRNIALEPGCLRLRTASTPVKIGILMSFTMTSGRRLRAFGTMPHHPPLLGQIRPASDSRTPVYSSGKSKMYLGFSLGDSGGHLGYLPPEPWQLQFVVNVLRIDDNIRCPAKRVRRYGYMLEFLTSALVSRRRPCNVR